MKKLLIAFLLTISCICTAAGISACSDSSDKYVDGVKYSLSPDETCYYVGRIDETYTDIEILSEYNGLPVTKILDGVFDDCTALKNITIGDNITSGIDGKVLRYCTALESINVTSGNTDYKSIDGNLYNNDETALIKYSVCKTDKSFEIPDSVTYISSYAFYGSTSLENVTIPDIVTSIYTYAFYGCTSLESIAIPDSVTDIGQGAFRDCTSLTSLSIGKNINKLSYYVFYNCTSLTDIYYNPISAKMEGNSGTHAFSYAGNDGEGLTVTIGNCVEKIPAYLFYVSYESSGSNVTYYTNKIVSIIFEEDSICESIGSASLNGNYITTLTIPNSVKTIGSGAFYGCEDLETLNLGNGVEIIYSQAFQACNSLKSVNIPSSVTYIADYAFAYCEALESVSFANTSGWYITNYFQAYDPDNLNANTGTKITVTNSSQNAANFLDTYKDYYWYRITN